MAWLTINASDKSGYNFHFDSNIYGKTMRLFELNFITRCRLPKYHEYVATLEKDENGQPILPDLGITTVEVDEYSEFGKSIQAYLDENGGESISELVFDIENQAFVVDEAVRKERNNGRLLAAIRAERDQKIVGVEWVIHRHHRETTLGLESTLTEDQVREVHQYIQDLADFPVTVDLENVVWPVKPDFI